MHTKTQLVELLRAHGMRLTKHLGQHYLVDMALAKAVIADCGLSPADHVIELGAGLGALTDLLAGRVAHVEAVEVDARVCGILRERLAAHPNVTVRCADILALPWTAFGRVSVVGAIPYQITAPILVMLSEHVAQVAGAWLGMQLEVARRLHASPGTKTYGRLSVLIQYRFTARLIRRMPRTAFFPEPDVDSMWVHLAPRPTPAVTVRDEPLFFDIVKAAFAQRRKMLVNCLSLVSARAVPKALAESALRRAGLPPAVRGEALSLEQFAQVTEAVDALAARA